jgi:hypothetical protein
MATLTVQLPAAAGEVISLTAAAGGGDEYANGGREMFVCDNADASPMTVTFTAQRACDLGSLHDSGPHTVTNATRKYFPGLDPNRFNDGDTNRVAVTYSAVTSVTVGVLKGA